MSLDKLVEDEKEDKSSRKGEWLSDVIDDLEPVDEYSSINNPSRDDVCPTCFTDNTEQVAYYWRCNNSESCDVVTYIP